MRIAPDVIVSSVGLWLALVLVVPKRNWRTIMQRIRATAKGERTYLFGAPRRVGSRSLPNVVSEGLAEMPRCLELGIPLWLLALAAEWNGVKALMAHVEAWADSPLGWMWSLVHGYITEEEFRRRSADRGFPLPAEKAERSSRDYVVPPAAWLRRDDVATPSRLEAIEAIPVEEELSLQVADPVLTIQTLGRFQVATADGANVTNEVLRRRILGYLWNYLLIRALDDPGRPVPRSAAGDELYPGIDTDEQLKGIRNRIYDMHHNLPSELMKPLIIDERQLMFDITVCRIDAVEVLTLADAVWELEPGSLTEGQFAKLQGAVANSASEFLPDWESLQQKATRGRGDAGEYVRRLRSRLEVARADLLVRLGHHHLANKDVNKAVTSFDDALQMDSGRAGLVEELVEALEAAGQPARAAELRKRHSD